MSHDLPVQELEVSVQTAVFLQKLGVTTVGELLAIPVLRAPKMVATELQLVLEDLGVKYPGELQIEAPKALRTATGKILPRWRIIEAYLEEYHPGLAEAFRPPANSAQLAAAEVALGHPLPEDYRRFLLVHDGQDDGAPMVHTCSLFPVTSLAAEHKALCELFPSPGDADEDLVGAGIRPVEYSPSWIPIGRSARGRDFLCLDLDPLPTGRRGQVVLVSVDFDDRPLVAASFADLLSLFFDQVQTGELKVEEEDAEDMLDMDDVEE